MIVDAQLSDPSLEPCGLIADEEDQLDPRWPTHCVCGHRFHPEEAWQINYDRLYRGFPDGKLYILQDRDMPPGAMWDADWMGKNFAGPDGKCWVVMLPGGVEFLIYGYEDSNEKKRWNVTGSVPNLTITPSINCPGVYHGFIQNGIITEDCEGRTFPNVHRTA